MNAEITAVLMPFFIFCARICDVSLGTLRTISVIRGRVALASALGFVEVLIWVFAITRLMKALDSPANMISWAAGFAAGNAVGILIERRLAFGQSLVRILSHAKSADVAAAIRGRGYAVSEFDGRGQSGPLSLQLVVTRRRDVPVVREIAETVDPQCFLLVEDLRTVNRTLKQTLLPALGCRNGQKP